MDCNLTGIQSPSSYRRVTPMKTGAVSSERQKHFLLDTGVRRYDGSVFLPDTAPAFAGVTTLIY
jgi:hypothetical protein